MLSLLLVATLLGQNRPGPPPLRSGGARHQTELRCGDHLGFQVLLDRRGISPGEIDGAAGPNLQRAVSLFQESAGLAVTGRADCHTWRALTGDDAAETLTDYAITDADMEGPFLDVALPVSLVDQAKLATLAYASAPEALTERFHASPRLLARLNPGHPVTVGSTLRVPAVTPFDSRKKPEADPSAEALTIQVSRRRSMLRATRADGTLVFAAPVSSGSDHDPLPIGNWKVTGVAWMPPFQYNPELFWDSEPGHAKATTQSGPNNPVGVVWVDIDVPHYGLHGTPSPGRVGHAESHGCVRLTNWDAARLASLVRPGTRVVFSK